MPLDNFAHVEKLFARAGNKYRFRVWTNSGTAIAAMLPIVDTSANKLDGCEAMAQQAMSLWPGCKAQVDLTHSKARPGQIIQAVWNSAANRWDVLKQEPTK